MSFLGAWSWHCYFFPFQESVSLRIFSSTGQGVGNSNQIRWQHFREIQGQVVDFFSSKLVKLKVVTEHSEFILGSPISVTQKMEEESMGIPGFSGKARLVIFFISIWLDPKDSASG